MHIPVGHGWQNKMIKDVTMPTGALALMIKRDKETITTKGDTLILAGDDIIFSVPPYTPSENEELEERVISKRDAWCNKLIGELELGADELIAMVLRGDESIIPDGKTKLLENDVVVLYKR
jgi:cell volume regulation protein A